MSNCVYYPGAKPGKKHVLNKQYALNSKLRLLTCVYDICEAHLLLHHQCELQVSGLHTTVKLTHSYVMGVSLTHA